MKARSRVAAFALLALELVGCGGSKAPLASNPVRSAIAPSDLLPDDLDFVLRVDVARLEQDAVLAAVVRDLARKSATTMMSEMGTLLERSSAVFVGGRWMSDGFHGDGVIVIESRETGNEASRDGFLPRASPSPDIEVLERSVKERSEAAIKVIFRDRGVVLATLSEEDAVLRVLGSGADRARLDPPARGVVSFAGRPGGEFLSPAGGRSAVLAACAEGLRSYAGILEPGEAIGVEVSLEFGTEEARSRASTCVRGLLERLGVLEPKLRSMSDSTKLTEIGCALRVESQVPFAWLAAVR